MPETTIRGRAAYRDVTVPYVLLWRDGRPCFTEMDVERVLECVSENLCGVCGHRLSTRRRAWIGGSQYLDSTELFFGDPPMHIACARYAIRSCPFLQGKKDRDDVEGLYLFIGTGLRWKGVNSRPNRLCSVEQVR